MAGQRRHFVHTIHKAHLGDVDMTDDDFISAVMDLFNRVGEDTGNRFLTGQIEQCPETGRLHAQCYSEWSVSLRLAEVAKRLPSHVELRNGTRTEARVYATKSETRVQELPVIGVWRDESDTEKTRGKMRMKDVALLMICGEGKTPDDIALEAPEVYFTHARKIVDLYEARQRATARLARQNRGPQPSKVGFE